MIDQHFDPASAEQKIYSKWEESKAFSPDMETSAEAYAIVIPPPNVTGVLHMGHALNHTLQDILIRFERMRGKKVLWQPGTDHAGIATQMVVERKLAAEGNMSRRDLGRDKFIEKVWEWKHESGGRIVEQDKRLGVSADWSRERFTMDEGLSAAVRKTFVELYNEGLIYRAKRLVNWDPHFQTAISNLEVENIEVDGHMWHFKYPLAGGETYTYVEKDEDGNVTLEEERDYISIATTRPETMLGDGAVAVHPSDERYAPIVGKLCEIPVGPKEHRRLIPIITDDYPDPDFGSGAVKITGAHDPNDYMVAKRGNIPMYALMDEKASMRADGRPYAEEAATAKRIAEGAEDWTEASIAAMNLVPEAYRGLDRFEARERVVADITAEGLAVMIPDPKFKPGEGETEADAPLIPFVEKKKIQQPFGDRSKVVIEPMLTDQWFVDAETLAKPALKAVADGETSFVPETWKKTYDNWLNDIEPWCISRQLWWGHRIPAWYGPAVERIELDDGWVETYGWGKPVPFCGETFEEAVQSAFDYYKDIGVKCEIVGDDYADSEIEAQERSGQVSEDGFYRVTLYRDPDVLDTWFSSALWPFSTMGWPEKTPELETFYPGAVLVTAFDIIFFWVARMMMFGLHFMKEIPFKDVYIHALVLDENGKKMSKSEGNVLDPIDIIDGCDLDVLIEKRLKDARTDDTNKLKQIEKKTKNQFPEGIPACGTDALRFTLASQAAQGRDIRLSIDRIVGYRNFGTKLWNAARFCQMNECTLWERETFDPKTLKQPINRWIVGELAATVGAVTEAIEGYRFNDASMACYRFIWNTFCDWYLELIKPLLNGDDDTAKAETRQTAAWVLDETLKVLHPFMPFITEELWEQLAEFGPGRDQMLISSNWPAYGAELQDADAEAEISWVVDFISEVRAVRGDLNVPPGKKVPLSIVGASGKSLDRLDRYRGLIERLARLDGSAPADDVPKGAITTVLGEATLCLDVAEVIDIADEVQRLEKEVKKLTGDVAGIDKKLLNEKFMSKAPEEVVAEQRERKAVAETRLEKLSSALERLKAI